MKNERTRMSWYNTDALNSVNTPRPRPTLQGLVAYRQIRSSDGLAAANSNSQYNSLTD